MTFGTYDGVHIGHRRLIEQARRLAAASGWRSVVLTFDRHPGAVVRPEGAPLLLTCNEHRIELLRGTGVDELVVLEFDAERASEPAEAFVEEILAGRLGARSVIVGAGFRFGYGRIGDVEMLARMGNELGFSASALELVTEVGSTIPVSSSYIRGLVAAGSLEEASRLLGRDHEVRGLLEVSTSEAPRREGDRALSVAVGVDLSMPPAGTYRGRLGPVGGELVEVALAVRPGTWRRRVGEGTDERRYVDERTFDGTIWQVRRIEVDGPPELADRLALGASSRAVSVQFAPIG